MKVFKLHSLLSLIFAAGLFYSQPSSACTGITLNARDGSKVIARTMEWGGFDLGSHLIMVPRGYTHKAWTPTGFDGLTINTKYGYAGIGVLEHNFVAEAVNEKGLAVELFYFPNYGKSEKYDPQKKSITITDAEFLAWVVGNFATVDEMVSELYKIRLVEYGNGFAAPHYNIKDASGHHVVLEYYDGKFHVHENKVGIITNAPYFEWMVTNLNNYVNVFASSNKPRQIAPGVTLRSFGVGSASYGLPGDLTPPSRFVRAAFYKYTACPTSHGKETVMQAFQILNNFDIPVGTEFNEEERKNMPDMLSATQWTTAIDLSARKFYYRTQWNSTIRCIDLKDIDFAKAKYQVLPLDKVKEQPIEYVSFK